MNILTFDQHINEKSPCWDGYKQLGVKKKNGKPVPNCVPVDENKEEEESLQEFSKNRLAGATKIAQSAKEKGGDALLTYHHFRVKLPYYKKGAEDSLDFNKIRSEYKDLLEELYSATKDGMNIDQVAFQKLVGEIEVLGELIIRKENNG
jgi:hypothetical protein